MGQFDGVKDAEQEQAAAEAALAESQRSQAAIEKQRLTDAASGLKDATDVTPIPGS
jgi:hypothetical protein